MTALTPPKKPVSERRKQQNRQAQKNYRERQNRRLQSLAALVESREVSLSNHAAPGFSSAIGISALTPESMVTGEDVLPAPETFIQASTSNESAASINDQWIRHDTLGGSQVLLPQMAGTSRAKSPSQSELSPTFITSDTISRLLDEGDRRVLESEGLSIQDVLKAGIQAISKHPPAQRGAPHSSHGILQGSSNAQEPAIRTDKIYLIENAAREHTHYLPDLHANSIRIKQLCVVAALRRNSEMLGVTFEQLIDMETDSSLFDPSHIAHEGQSSNGGKFEHLSRDLRPMPAQLKYPHSAWIDAMPSPTIRQRLIECINSEPPIVDEDEFCEDLGRDALICWGSTGSKTERPIGSGAPWDVRSWEAQPWFLRKWWFLVGGRNGELFQASKWWNEMRGDALPYAWQ